MSWSPSRTPRKDGGAGRWACPGRAAATVTRSRRHPPERASTAARVLFDPVGSSDHGKVIMVMSTEQEVNVSTFKAKCLGLLDEVAETGRPLIVTKRGRPVARVVAVEDPPSLRNSVRFLVSDDEIVEPIDAAWNATRR